MTDERISLKSAIPILGLKERTVRDMAARGELPGAAFYRGRWTFNAAKLRQYVRDMEAALCQREMPRRAVSGVAKPYGAASRLKAGTSNGLYAQTIQKLRDAAARSSGTAK